MSKNKEAENLNHPGKLIAERLIRFEFYGREMIEKRVNSSGNSGRVYLPSDWVDHNVKIIRID